MLEPAGALAIDALARPRPARRPARSSPSSPAATSTSSGCRTSRSGRCAGRAGRNTTSCGCRSARGRCATSSPLLGPEDDIARFEYLKKSARNFGSVLLGIESGSRAQLRRPRGADDRGRLPLARHHRRRRHHQPDRLTMQLAATVHGAPTDRPPLVIAHGLFGSGRNWGAIARRLAEHAAGGRRRHAQPRRQSAEPRARLRGDGRRPRRRPSPASAGRADLLGHSMGGKAAMVLALTEPGAGAPADRRRHRAGRLRPQPDRLCPGDAGRRPRRGAPARRRRRGAGGGGPRAGAARLLPAEPRGRPRAARRGSSTCRSLAERDAADHGLPRGLRRASTVRRCS